MAVLLLSLLLLEFFLILVFKFDSLDNGRDLLHDSSVGLIARDLLDLSVQL